MVGTTCEEEEEEEGVGGPSALAGATLGNADEEEFPHPLFAVMDSTSQSTSSTSSSKRSLLPWCSQFCSCSETSNSGLLLVEGTIGGGVFGCGAEGTEKSEEDDGAVRVVGFPLWVVSESANVGKVEVKHEVLRLLSSVRNGMSVSTCGSDEK